MAIPGNSSKGSAGRQEKARKRKKMQEGRTGEQALCPAFLAFDQRQASVKPGKAEKRRQKTSKNPCISRKSVVCFKGCDIDSNEA